MHFQTPQLHTDDFLHLRRKAERLAYDFGVASESLFQLICALDSVTGDDCVRKERRALILSIKKDIADTDKYTHLHFDPHFFLIFRHTAAAHTQIRPHVRQTVTHKHTYCDTKTYKNEVSSR
jgi:hypothetical protein